MALKHGNSNDLNADTSSNRFGLAMLDCQEVSHSPMDFQNQSRSFQRGFTCTLIGDPNFSILVLIAAIAYNRQRSSMEARLFPVGFVDPRSSSRSAKVCATQLCCPGSAALFAWHLRSRRRLGKHFGDDEVWDILAQAASDGWAMPRAFPEIALDEWSVFWTFFVYLCLPFCLGWCDIWNNPFRTAWNHQPDQPCFAIRSCWACVTSMREASCTARLGLLAGWR